MDFNTMIYSVGASALLGFTVEALEAFGISGILALIPALIARKMQRSFLRWWICSTISILVALLVGASLFAVYSMRTSVVKFYTPATIPGDQIRTGQNFRLGGLIVAGSLIQDQPLHVELTVTDKIKDVKISYQGPVPSLLRGGECVVSEGALAPTGEFIASNIEIVTRDNARLSTEVVKALQKTNWCQETK